MGVAGMNFKRGTTAAQRERGAFGGSRSAGSHSRRTSGLDSPCRGHGDARRNSLFAAPPASGSRGPRNDRCPAAPEWKPSCAACCFRGKTTKKPMLFSPPRKQRSVNARCLSLWVRFRKRPTPITTERVTDLRRKGFPFRLSTRLPIVMDETLAPLGRIWCMAGSADLIMSVPNSIMNAGDFSPACPTRLIPPSR